jgi:hypothetical protein
LPAPTCRAEYWPGLAKALSDVQKQINQAAPDRHRDVLEYCLKPLCGEYLTEETETRLKAALPELWAG